MAGTWKLELLDMEQNQQNTLLIKGWWHSCSWWTGCLQLHIARRRYYASSLHLEPHSQHHCQRLPGWTTCSCPCQQESHLHRSWPCVDIDDLSTSQICCSHDKCCHATHQRDRIGDTPCQRHCRVQTHGRIRGPNSVFITHNAVFHNVVAHADHEDPSSLWRSSTHPIHCTFPQVWTNHDILAECVSQLISIFDVQAVGFCIPDHILIHSSIVGSMDGNANMLSIHNGIALKHTARALFQEVKMKAVAPHHCTLSAKFYSGIAHVHVARTICLYGV